MSKYDGGYLVVVAWILASSFSGLAHGQPLQQELMKNRQQLSDVRNEIQSARQRLRDIQPPRPAWALPMTVTGGILAGGPLVFGAGYLVYSFVYLLSFGSIGSFFSSLPLAIVLSAVASVGLIILIVGLSGLLRKNGDSEYAQQREEILELKRRYRRLKLKRRKLLRELQGNLGFYTGPSEVLYQLVSIRF